MCYGYSWAEGSVGPFPAPGAMGAGPNVQEDEESSKADHETPATFSPAVCQEHPPPTPSL